MDRHASIRRLRFWHDSLQVFPNPEKAGGNAAVYRPERWLDVLWVGISVSDGRAYADERINRVMIAINLGNILTFMVCV